jgi:hypothetical protein
MRQKLKSFTHWQLALTFAGAVVGAAVSVANRSNSLLMGAFWGAIGGNSVWLVARLIGKPTSRVVIGAIVGACLAAGVALLFPNVNAQRPSLGAWLWMSGFGLLIGAIAGAMPSRWVIGGAAMGAAVMTGLTGVTLIVIYLHAGVVINTLILALAFGLTFWVGLLFISRPDRRFGLVLLPFLFLIAVPLAIIVSPLLARMNPSALASLPARLLLIMPFMLLSGVMGGIFVGALVYRDRAGQARARNERR